MSQKYEVIRPWHGVKKGEVVTLKSLHPSLKPNVRPISEAAALEVATPGAPSVPAEGKQLIIARLKELKIGFDGRKGADDLAALLPEGELQKLFPAE